MLKAHECLLKSNELLDAIRTLRSGSDSYCLKEECEGGEQCFVELGWQSPDLVVTLNVRLCDTDNDSHDRTQNNLEGVIFVIQY